MYFKQHIFLFTVIPLLVLAIAASYYRFMVLHDYMVFYEGGCDPLTESCFVGCEDDECLEEYYYTEIERYAAYLYALCGTNISDCDAAQSCTEEEHQCSMTYCDPEIHENLCEDMHNDTQL